MVLEAGIPITTVSVGEPALDIVDVKPVAVGAKVSVVVTKEIGVVGTPTITVSVNPLPLIVLVKARAAFSVTVVNDSAGV